MIYDIKKFENFEKEEIYKKNTFLENYSKIASLRGVIDNKFSSFKTSNLLSNSTKVKTFQKLSSSKNKKIITHVEENEKITMKKHSINLALNKKSKFFEDNLVRGRNKTVPVNITKKSNTNNKHSTFSKIDFKEQNSFQSCKTKKSKKLQEVFSYEKLRKTIKETLPDFNENEKELNYKKDYIDIKKEDMKLKKIWKQNWSGNDILKIGIKIKKLKRIFKDLSYFDKAIWIKGLKGKVKLFLKFFLTNIILKIKKIFIFFLKKILNNKKNQKNEKVLKKSY